VSNVLPGRSSGVLLHPTSLPGGPIGDLGTSARVFIEWLAGAGQSFWQILPLVAIDEGGSPYNGISAAGANPLLISLELLLEDGLLRSDEIHDPAGDTTARVDFDRATRLKLELLTRAHGRMEAGANPGMSREFEEYRVRNAGWLEDFTLFRALRDAHGGAAWTEWRPELRDRDVHARAAAREKFAREIEISAFRQYLFDRQWSDLREYAETLGVRIIGDIPIFVAHDSADVWANQDIFRLDQRGRPVVVAGVPPDYFSETGQRWGNPLFRWDVLRERNYDWWVARFRRTLSWVDVIRIDHFRGFESYWEIPADEETAVNGQWRTGPGAEFFHVVERELGIMPVIAEDLGLITKSVEELRDELGFPGMRVIQFAFDGDPQNPHLPVNYATNTVAYTGTHDNDTIAGWWEKSSADERQAVRSHFEVDPLEPHWGFVERVLDSRASLAIVPAQDILGLGSEARMNTPGTTAENWVWRLHPDELTAPLQDRLRAITYRSGRLTASGRNVSGVPVGHLR
jgi:4-alpha-glucanotransferase